MAVPVSIQSLQQALQEIGVGVGENCPSVSTARGTAAEVCRGTLLPPRQEALEQRCPVGKAGVGTAAPSPVPAHRGSPRHSRAAQPRRPGMSREGAGTAPVPEEENLGHRSSPRTSTSDAAKGNKLAGERGTNWLESNRGMERSNSVVETRKTPEKVSTWILASCPQTPMP